MAVCEPFGAAGFASEASGVKDHQEIRKRRMASANEGPSTAKRQEKIASKYHSKKCYSRASPAKLFTKRAFLNLSVFEEQR